MEAREPGAVEKAARLVDRYRLRFDGIFATFHPQGLPGQTPAKGSNEAWAAREAYLYLIDAGRLGNDCVLTDGYWKTLRAHYAQSVRHAWGTSDIPYAWRGALNGASPLRWPRKVLLAAAVTKVHVLWAAQWYFVTLGLLLPSKMAGIMGAPCPTGGRNGTRSPGPAGTRRTSWTSQAGTTSTGPV